jgi:hypothetical protein
VVASESDIAMASSVDGCGLAVRAVTAFVVLDSEPGTWATSLTSAIGVLIDMSAGIRAKG